MSKRKLGTFICAHDGITNLYAGLGTASDSYFSGIDQVRCELDATYEIRVWAITPWSAPSNCGHCPAQSEIIRRICRSTGDDVLECFNVSEGFNRYGGISNWTTTSPTAALLAYQVLKDLQADDALAVAAYTPVEMMSAILERPVDFQLTQRDNTEMVAVLSRHEASELIPMEIRAYGNALVHASNVGGLSQVHHGINGFVTESPVDPLARTMREMLSLPETRNSEIAAASVTLTQDDTLFDNFVAALTQLLERE